MNGSLRTKDQQLTPKQRYFFTLPRINSCTPHTLYPSFSKFLIENLRFTRLYLYLSSYITKNRWPSITIEEQLSVARAITITNHNNN